MSSSRDGAVSDEIWATDAQSARNPFLVALWVLGFTLIAGGLWAAWRAFVNQNRSGYNPEEGIPIEVMLAQLTWLLAPAMVSTGFLVLAGLIFERAFRWQREHRAAERS